MRKTIDAVWKIFLMIWTVCNGELHGKDYDEQGKITLVMTQEEVSRVYENAKHYVNDEESAILNFCPVLPSHSGTLL
jgi:hypothetical protein